MTYAVEDVSDIVELCGGVSAPAWVFVRCQRSGGAITSYCIIVSNEIGCKTLYYWNKSGTKLDMRRYKHLFSDMYVLQKEKTAEDAVRNLHDFFCDRRVVCFDAQETYYPLCCLFEGNGNEPRGDILDLQETAKAIFKSKEDFNLNSVMGYLGMEGTKKEHVIDQINDVLAIHAKLERLGLLEINR